MQIKTIVSYFRLLPKTNKIEKHFYENVEKLGSLCTIGGNVKWYRYYGKQYGKYIEIKK
jgi:hypothetical protein